MCKGEIEGSNEMRPTVIPRDRAFWGFNCVLGVLEQNEMVTGDCVQ